MENRAQTVGESWVLYPLSLLSFLSLLLIMGSWVLDTTLPTFFKPETGRIVVLVLVIFGFSQSVLILLWNFIPKKWISIEKPWVLYPLSIFSLTYLFIMGGMLSGGELHLHWEIRLLLTGVWNFSFLSQSVLIILWFLFPKKGMSIDKHWALFPITLLTMVTLFIMGSWVFAGGLPSTLAFSALLRFMFLVWILSYQSLCALILLSYFIPEKGTSRGKPWIIFPLTLLTLTTQLIMIAWIFREILPFSERIRTSSIPIMIFCAFFQGALILLWNFISQKRSQ